MKRVLMLLMSVIIVVTACSSADDTAFNSSNDETTDVLIDVNQFSRISPEELVEIMGEPEEIQDFPWSVPKTGESISGKLYIYQENRYEFIVLDGTVVRMKINSPKFNNVNGEGIYFESEESLFTMFNIPITDRIKKVVDDGLNLRYSPVSDKVADVWIQEIEDEEFTIASITFNLNYF